MTDPGRSINRDIRDQDRNPETLQSKRVKESFPLESHQPCKSQVRVVFKHKQGVTVTTHHPTLNRRGRGMSEPSHIDEQSRATLPIHKRRVNAPHVLWIVKHLIGKSKRTSTGARMARVFVGLHKIQDAEDEFRWQTTEWAGLHSRVANCNVRLVKERGKLDVVDSATSDGFFSMRRCLGAEQAGRYKLIRWPFCRVGVYRSDGRNLVSCPSANHKDMRGVTSNTRALYFNRQSRDLSLAANKKPQAQSHSKTRSMQIHATPSINIADPECVRPTPP
jgi:hypothetical protein